MNRFLWGLYFTIAAVGVLGQTKPQITQLPKSSNRYAILIGVGKYSDPNITPLSDPPLDVKALQRVLEDSAGFLPENIRVLSDESGNPEPTRAAILGELSKIKNSVSGESLLLLMFAGHGIVSKDKAFIMPKDAQLTEDVQYLSDTSIAVDLLRERVAETQVKQAIILLDTCRDDPLAAHGISTNRLNPTFRRSFDFDKINSDIQASAVIYATDIGYRAFVDRNTQLGYFSEVLVDGLDGRAADSSGRVTLSNLLTYLQTDVPKRVKHDLPLERQQPIYDVSGYKATDLVLATRPRTVLFTVNDSSGRPVTVDAGSTPPIVSDRNVPDPRNPTSLRSMTYDFDTMFANYSQDELALANLGEDAFLKGNYAWTIKYLEQARKIQSSRVWTAEYPFLAAAYLLGNNDQAQFQSELNEMLNAMSVPNTYLHHAVPIQMCLTRLSTVRRLVPQRDQRIIDDVVAQIDKLGGSGGLQPQQTSQACEFQGEAPHGGNAWLKQESCIIPDVEHLDKSYHQGQFLCCGGGAQSPTTAADIPAGLELITTGSVYWSVANPVLDSDKFSLTTYCGPSAATLTTEGCGVRVAVVAHYRY